MFTRLPKFVPLTAAAVAVAFSFAPQSASALQVEFEYMGKFNGSTLVNYTRDDSLPGTAVVGPRNSNPGVFSMREWDGGLNGTDPLYTPGVDDFLAWCFDVDKLIARNVRSDYTINLDLLNNNPPYKTGAKDRIQKLFDKSYNLDLFASTNTNQSANSAGFQIAIWEVLYDDVYDLDDGAFKLNDVPQGSRNDGAQGAVLNAAAAAKTAAAGFLAGSADYTGVRNWIITTYDSGPNGPQDLGVATAIPLPAAAWLLLGVSGALVAAKRRKSNRAA